MHRNPAPAPAPPAVISIQNIDTNEPGTDMLSWNSWEMDMKSYPPSPAAVPRDFIAPNRSYQLRVGLVLFAIVLFIALYLGLIAAAVWVIGLLWTGLERDPNLFYIGAMAIVLMFLAFMIKGLVKRKRHDNSHLIEITREQEPELFAFLDQLTADTGAPFPKHVYLSAEVNAAVFYDSSFLSLFKPVRKNLLIGLGLINSLNVSELKGVLAHEFGHFSQRSMKLGTYVYVANRIISDMVWGRDRWDEVLAAWGRLDIRVAFFAWVLAAGVWLLRRMLGLLLRFNVLVEASLSRQMEFQADRVAVSVAGSDAICHALFRLGFADACMAHTLSELNDATDHALFTDDIFYHQERAAEFLRRVSGKPEWGVPPPIPAEGGQDARIFERDERATLSMWASHPPHPDREDNAKSVYIPCAMDERPAWVLFRDPAELRAKVTGTIMRMAHGDQVALSPAEVVQRFIDSERAESTYDERYHGMYDGRRISPGDVAKAMARARSAPTSADELADAHANLHGDELIERMARIKELRAELVELVQVMSGQARGRVFQFRGQEYSRNAAGELGEEVSEEMDELHAWLRELDEKVLDVHMQMAARTGEALMVELGERYGFHLALQELHRGLEESRSTFEGVLEFLADAGELDEGEYESVCLGCRAAHDGLNEAYEGAQALDIPKLENMEAGASLGGFLFPDGLVDDYLLLARRFDGALLQGLIEQYGQVLGRLVRLHFKSMGGILALQERIGEAWTAMTGATAQAET
jgi:Zn-dependent protease with chaperone function